MNGAELAIFRPRVVELGTLSDEQAASLGSLERRIAEGIANADKSAIQLRGLAVEVGGMIHQLNSLKVSIIVMLDELDRLAPVVNDTTGGIPVPPAPESPRSKKKRAGHA